MSMETGDMEPGDRLKTVAIGAVSNAKIQSSDEGGEKPTPTLLDGQTVEALTADWPKMSKSAANEVIKKYGLPNEGMPSRLIWYNTGPWKRTIVNRDEIPHNFPQPHSDVLEQFIDYQVPPERVSDLARFDGSVIVERTKGEVSARCDMEAANILAINLMHEIVTGKRTVEEAREFYSETSAAYVMNRPAPYAEAFQFPLPQGDTTDADETIIMGDMVKQGVEKVKDIFR
ncbi:MAG: hypothetical protein KY468_13075 [Armatimonadetes bacterium]|nr:hypothetical protein [Armatimonadota bacterium]